jgi:hypothetical protein
MAKARSQASTGATTYLLPDAVERLPAAARADLLAAVETVTDPVTYAVIAAALAISERADASRWLDDARPDGIAQLADWRREAIPDEVIAKNIATAKAAVKVERDESISGHFSLGGTDARRALGSLAAQPGSTERLGWGGGIGGFAGVTLGIDLVGPGPKPSCRDVNTRNCC